MFELRRLLLASVLLIFGQSLLPGGDSKDKKAPGLPETVSYYKDVRPIFAVNCHGSLRCCLIVNDWDQSDQKNSFFRQSAT